MSKYPNIKIIKRTGNYLRRDAIKEMEGVIKNDIHIDAIFPKVIVCLAVLEVH